MGQNLPVWNRLPFRSSWSLHIRFQSSCLSLYIRTSHHPVTPSLDRGKEGLNFVEPGSLYFLAWFRWHFPGAVVTEHKVVAVQLWSTQTRASLS